MKNRWISIGLILTLTCGGVLAGQSLKDALEQVDAPQQEFIRIPASYVIKTLAKTARNSGESVLAAFDIENTLSETTELNVNFTGMNMLEAIDTLAESLGGGVDYQDQHAVIMDASLLPETSPSETKEEPTQRRSKKEEAAPLFSFDDISHSLVFVENGEGRGSGFIAKMDDKTYFFSNQHNLKGARKLVFKTMNGAPLKPKSFEYNRSLDLFRMLLSEDDLEGLCILPLCTETPSIDDPIFLFGNSGGGDVATKLDGEILGVGPENIEVTAKMIPGNSGSPILNRKGEVVGVATYVTQANFEKGSAYEKIFKGTRFTKVRRYGLRIPDTGWVSDNLSLYLKQTYTLEDMQTYLAATYTLLRYSQGDSSAAAAAKSMMSHYESSSNTGNAIYEFKLKENEKRLRQLVHSFSLSFKETESRIGKRSSTEEKMEAERILRMFSDAMDFVKTEIRETRWKSSLLIEDAKAVIEAAEAITQQIDALEE